MPVSNGGVYEVKKGYQLPSGSTPPGLEDSNYREGFWKKLWRLKNPVRITTFLWKFLKNALPIKLGLEKRNIASNTRYVVCHSAEEDLDHLFLSCTLAKAI